MISVGRILLRIVAALEIGVFTFYLVGGVHGLRALQALQEKNETIMQQLCHKERELAATRAEIEDWQKYPFYKEQYAREHLQMARKDDEVYLL